MTKNYLMILLTALFLIGGIALLFADSTKLMRLKKLNSEIKVDGIIDPIWAQADSVSDFIQHEPYFDKEPSRKTTAKLITSEKSLYCLIRCEEDKKNIQQRTGKLDDYGGDVVSLMLDTFGDKRTAYKFAVSASGIRNDCRLLDDARNRDYSWDGVWFSAAKIYDWGFVIEMEIPYRSIQYDEKLNEWGLDFDRWIPTRNEDIYWCRYEENEGQRISKFGRLIFEDFKPSVKGLNFEIYPVGISKAEYQQNGKYDVQPNAGIDLFYNPSQQLTYQLTANPDFAQIEADPFTFNISRYESYFDERRPFFTQGNEVFMPSGREQNTGFYRPLELFYSRRIGKKLPNGSEVPLLLGTKAFGRIKSWEYGGFLAATGEKNYVEDNVSQKEPQAYFGSARLKKQIFSNSSIGILYVGKQTQYTNNGVLDVDGAFRMSDWQLSYQLARSYKNSQGDFAVSSGLTMFKDKMILGVRSRYIGKDFDIDEVGFVPWKGTGELTSFFGPRWYFKKGYIQSILVYTGGAFGYERVDAYTDRLAILGLNMQFRNNWGYEITLLSGRAKDQEKLYTYYESDFSVWFSISPKWSGNVYGAYLKTYNFARDYLAYYTYAQGSISWQLINELQLGTSLNVFVELNPLRHIEDVTVNTRPYFSLTPINNLNIRMYLDNVYVQSTDRIQQLIGGFLFSYNFRPKSWIYLAINEVQDRSEEYNTAGVLLPNRLHTTGRVSVFKLKYLFYF